MPEGFITKEYLDNCVEVGYNRDKLGSIGEKLNADPEYVKKATEIFIVIGIKLIQVIWRKLCEDYSGGDLDGAGMCLVATTFELNRSSKYKISAQIGSFACGATLKRYKTERAKRILYVNYAASQMLQGKTKDAKQTLARLDWSTVSDEFAISVAAIEGDLRKVCGIMKRWAKTDAGSKKALQEWPVFFEIRKDSKFIEAFEKAFSDKFIPKRSAKQIDVGQRQAILKEIKSMLDQKKASYEQEAAMQENRTLQ